ncbi:hypothetical protein K402DRAFT_85740 [Aulographum hederae CBS 113979]|uniref:Uncharacterized protein n=1 Tax=Aulographum hederae CBS 113979 TaxID=1176131 RepID=A0A6G1H0F9_9PEZI|nr:hypothetical protein K402DRAFT_85740 [Aulographum hederae CBS 113979]
MERGIKRKHSQIEPEDTRSQVRISRATHSKQLSEYSADAIQERLFSTQGEQSISGGEPQQRVGGMLEEEAYFADEERAEPHSFEETRTTEKPSGRRLGGGSQCYTRQLDISNIREDPGDWQNLLDMVEDALQDFTEEGDTAG